MVALIIPLVALTVGAKRRTVSSVGMSLAASAFVVIAITACAGKSGPSSNDAAVTTPSPASRSAVQASNELVATCNAYENGAQIVSDLLGFKHDLAVGHFARSERESAAFKTRAEGCIKAGADPSIFHYAHAFAAFVNAQDRMAQGDATGAAEFSQATTEAQALENSPKADAGTRKMAAALVAAARTEWQHILSTKPGEMVEAVTPPPE